MMIRICKDEDIDNLIVIWYNGSLQAHHFINSSYWKSKITEMKETYIPMSETHVIISKNKIIGFISMVDNYLAALFIDKANQKKGAGQALLNYEKKRRDIMELKVYKDNAPAVRFYKKNGFVITQVLTDEETNKQEYVMEWTKN
ncbi:N-acetyltransferase [Paraliobacillus ryukyuensis]|uniref:N-acetyltransferase n=1 Tax=Paraliobacillus ryukyuensis TaxID=200904 RepID=UPI002118AA69|nr:N-acetyltransferase [Paraliobacillus ryukyuensis]